jgi:RsiW-degrading membrane proteinase PrsW (M82 family)
MTEIAASSEPISEHPDQVVVAKPRRSGWVLAIAIVGFILITIILALVLVYLYAVLGPTALLYAGLLASLPLVAVLLGIRWVDRWEPEPRIVLLFAFFWGAAASVFIALVFSGITQSYLASRGLQKSSMADFFETVVQAPIVEETAKGLGVLLLFWVMRKYFDGPVDGIVYGATVGIGFAFTENIQYFGLAIIQDHGFGQGVGETFLLRAVLSPFAHVMFTSVTGLALGIAARDSNRVGAIGYFLLGLVPAIFLHGFWNSAGYWATNWYLYYFFIQVPLFVIAIVGVVRLRRHEQVITHDRLSEYAGAGWFTQSEVNLISTGAGRRQVLAWAARYRLKRQYRRFLQDATRLAFTRQRLISGKDEIGARRYEGDLLEAIVADRRSLAALPPLLTVQPAR